jgi:hypothetical protein
VTGATLTGAKTGAGGAGNADEAGGVALKTGTAEELGVSRAVRAGNTASVARSRAAVAVTAAAVLVVYRLGSLRREGGVGGDGVLAVVGTKKVSGTLEQKKRTEPTSRNRVHRRCCWE